MAKIGFIGMGNMGSAILNGLLRPAGTVRGQTSS